MTYEYIRVEIRVYIIKKIWSGFLLRGITSSLRTFGCVCFVLLPNRGKAKLSSKTNRCIFVGYSSAHKGYRCYDPITKRLRIAKYVSFLENVPYNQSKPSP